MDGALTLTVHPNQKTDCVKLSLEQSAGGSPFRHFLLDLCSRLDDTTRIRQR
jgi:hypothetical protein